MEKLGKDIMLRYSNFGSEMIKNCRPEKVNFWVFSTNLLLMDLDQDQKQNIYLHRGELAGEGLWQGRVCDT